MDESDRKKGKNKGQNRKLSDQDRKIWQDYVSDEGLVLGDENFEALLNEESSVVEEKIDAEMRVDLEDDIKPRSNNESVAPAQLDRRTEEKLRKGKMTIEARLDLHGLNRTEAHQRLVRFLMACYEEKLRCVLVITGKGKSKSTSDDWLTPSKGVLKENAPLWLKDSTLNKIVLKFFNAQPKDGGSGALYVYLKRKR